MGNVFFVLATNAPISTGTIFLSCALLLLESCFPQSRTRDSCRAFSCSKLWAMIMSIFPSDNLHRTSKLSFLLLLSGVPCELEISSFYVLVISLFSGGVGMLWSWQNNRERLRNAQLDASISNWMANGIASASVHSLAILSAVVAGDRDFAYLYGCSESVARIALPLAQVVPFLLSSNLRMLRRSWVPVVFIACTIVVWGRFGPTLLVADMVYYYYILNCGINAVPWILRLSGGKNSSWTEYDALAHLIAGCTAACCGLILAKQLSSPVPLLKLSRRPLLTFVLSEGVIPRTNKWFRPN